MGEGKLSPYNSLTMSIKSSEGFIIIKTITSSQQFVTVRGKIYSFPAAALVVDERYLGVKLKMESLVPKENSCFLDVALTELQRTELRFIMEKELENNRTVKAHENFVVTGNITVSEGFGETPILSIQGMQVMRRLYAYPAAPVADKNLLYIVCDQKIAILIDEDGAIRDRVRLLPTQMKIRDLLNQLRNCAASEIPLDVKMEQPNNRHTLLLPRMVNGWHEGVAAAIEDFIGKPSTKTIRY